MLLKLSKDQRSKMADRICQEIDGSLNAISALKERWAKTRALYNNEKGQSTLNVIEGVEPYSLPLYRARADRITDSVTTKFTSVYPYVQVIEEGQTQTNSEVYERALMCLAEYSGFKRSFKRAFVECMNTDLGIIRVRPVVSDGRVVGIESERIKPEFMVGYPLYKSTFEECTTKGHQFIQSIRDIKRKQDDGLYYKDVEVTTTSVQDYVDANVSYSLTNVDTRVASEDEYDLSACRCYEVITEEKIGKEWQKVLVTIAYDTRVVLSVQEYTYPIDWYITMRIDDEDDTLFPSNSLGQRVQGLNQVFSDGYATLFLGSMAAAYPIVAIKGGTLGKEKFKRWQAGMMLELPDGAEIEVLSTAFNPSALPLALQNIYEITDSVLGISRVGTGQPLPAETREAAIEGILAAQNEAKEGYADAVSPAVKKYWQLLDIFFVSHFWELKNAYGTRLPIQDPQEVPGAYRLEVTGQNTSSSPSANQNKLNMLYGMAQNPMSIWSSRKVEEKIAQSMDLPFDTVGLKKDEFDAIVQMMAQMQEMGIPLEQSAQIVMSALQQFTAGAQLQYEANEATRAEMSNGTDNPGSNAGSPA